MSSWTETVKCGDTNLITGNPVVRDITSCSLPGCRSPGGTAGCQAACSTDLESGCILHLRCYVDTRDYAAAWRLHDCCRTQQVQHRKDDGDFHLEQSRNQTAKRALDLHGCGHVRKYVDQQRGSAGSVLQHYPGK